MTGAPRASRGRGRPKKADAAAAVAGGSLLQDDMHFADLLDGTVMPTVGNEPVAPSTNMSAQTDSIISLPPLTGAATRWKNLAPPVVPRQRHARHSSLGGPELKTMVAARRPPGSPVGGTIPRKLAAPAPSPLATAAPRRADRDPLVPHDVRIDLEPGVLRHGHSRRPSTEIKPALRAAHSRRPSGEIEPRFDVPGYGAIEGSNRNAHAYLALRREDDEMSAGGSSANGSLRDRRRNRLSRRKRGFPLTDDQETAWNWRFPGAEDALMPSMAWIYLPLIGWLIFVTALTVTGLEDVLLEWVIDPIEGVVAEVWGVGAGKIALALLRAMLLILSFGVVYYFAPLHGAGSGIPEMKCVLTGVFMPNVLSPSTLFAKVVGLVLAAASSISVGKLGPFMHMGGIIASQVSRLPFFKALNVNPLFKLQALSAAMAAGVGATFGAPIGGAMLAIELMSTYYYVHWLPMSLFCSIMGYYLILLTQEGYTNHAFFTPDVSLSLHAQPVFGIIVYGALGGVCGLAGWIFIRLTVLMKKTISHFFKIQRNPRRIVIFLGLFAILHTYITFAVGPILTVKQKKGVQLMFSTEEAMGKDKWVQPHLHLLGGSSFGASLALFIAMSVKFLLTSISLVLPVPAGTFMPIFELGALLGRSYGEFMGGIPVLKWLDPRATAIVGAASLVSGTLHITSIAVVMLELTREAVNALPITISVVVAYAVSKNMCSDLFSEFIKFRQLPYLLGLRERSPQETRLFFEEIAPVVAKNFMMKKFAFVTRTTTVADVRKLLMSNFGPVAFLSDEKERKLFGVIKRASLEREIELMRRRRPETSSGAGSVADAASITSSTNPAVGHTNEEESEPIGFLRDFELKIGHPLVDMGATQVSVHTPFWKVLTYFRMLSMNVMYVMTTGGSVAGVITKTDVAQQCYNLERLAKEKKRLQRDVDLQTRRAEKEADEKYAGSKRMTRKIAREMSQSNLAGLDPQGSGRRSRNASLKLSGIR